MSRIGKRVLTLTKGVTAEVKENTITVNGPKGTLSLNLVRNISVEVNGEEITVSRSNEDLKTKQMHGTTNALIANMIKGVSEGYSKGLEIIGVGYRFNVKPHSITVSAGYSHPVEIKIPSELTVESVSNTEIIVRGINNILVGEFAANIRKIRQPEPYKGKGIRYKDEKVRRKEGKKASK